ncbi:hypothetical protein C8J57DRAFT_1519973 [Mycena rebaudengoi]|nr:hypothetical protein C8J57DRAFT_1519973 [Mycena rebaudengoi]
MAPIHFIGASILTAATALTIHHISPTRLARVLVTLMHETDTIYIRTVEAGIVPSDVDADALFKLQIKIFLRPLARALPMHQAVQDLKTRIEISKQEQLRDFNPTGSETATAWTMSARRRHVHTPGSPCHFRCS